MSQPLVFTAILIFLELITRSSGSAGSSGSARSTGSGVINCGTDPPFHARRGAGEVDGSQTNFFKRTLYANESILHPTIFHRIPVIDFAARGGSKHRKHKERGGKHFHMYLYFVIVHCILMVFAASVWFEIAWRRSKTKHVLGWPAGPPRPPDLRGGLPPPPPTPPFLSASGLPEMLAPTPPHPTPNAHDWTSIIN